MDEPYKAGDCIAHTESDAPLSAASYEFIEKIRKRLASASGNDRRYERPMDWGEADKLVIEIDRLNAEIARLEAIIENMSDEAKYPRD